MTRVVVFLIVVALIALGFAWLADRPGDVAVTWLGYHIETSVAVAAVALLVLVLVLILLWTILRAVLRSPGHVSMFLRHRRAMRGYQAVSRGLIAIGSGDQRLAHRSADEAARLTPGDPLTLLLSAQSAQMAGDRAAAERAFRAMTLREETKILGLRGLYVEAQRRGDAEGARRAAEQAAKAAPALPWAGQAVLDNRCAASDWAGALDALERMKPGLAKAAYRRKRAVLLTARAQALDETERDVARGLALEAVKLAPDLVPAAAMAGRRLAEAGEQRRARRILEAAWKTSPHPDLADAYADLRLGDSARDRLTRMRKLADMVPGQLEGALAVARAALDAREFETARQALAPYVSSPTRRVAVLMAEVEETEHGDDGRVREWMSRAMRASGDPVWTADGVVSDHWLPVSPNGRLDGYQWRVPLAEIGVSRPVVEVIMPAAPPKDESEPPAAASSSKTEPPGEDRTGELPTPDRLPPGVAPAVAPNPVMAPAAQKRADTPAERPAVVVRAAEPVIPLVHAPDDPGPERAADGEPVPQPSDSPDAWHRIRQLFR
ncbi:MAG TPA: heme biosynthesis HemY N-terminal domain-containing protein [Pseudolabrys sp.]|nr:heme biosynthesis HemY N-terminal domain-containing protein [Pseudolabrys sp.]